MRRRRAARETGVIADGRRMSLFATTATIPRPSAGAINIAAITALRSCLGEDADAIVALFLTETRERLDRMADLSDVAQRNTLAREAHSLKSAAATFACEELASLALALEDEAATLDGALVPRRVAALADAYRRARSALLAGSQDDRD
jgi:HPt (histidine-containing phosphotransfer) domain-containing protein